MFQRSSRNKLFARSRGGVLAACSRAGPVSIALLLGTVGLVGFADILPGTYQPARQDIRGTGDGLDLETIDKKLAPSQLIMFAQHLWKPAFGELDKKLVWSTTQSGTGNFRTTVRLVPFGKTFRSTWLPTETQAKRMAAQVALASRLGDDNLGDYTHVLKQLVRHIADRDPEWLMSQTNTDQAVQDEVSLEVKLRLPAELFPKGSPLARKEFLGLSKRRFEAMQLAARPALLFLLHSVIDLPALQSSKGWRTAHSKCVFVNNFSPDCTMEAARNIFEQFGPLKDFTWKKTKEQCKGEITYEHWSNAWAASEILNRSPVSGRAVIVEQRLSQDVKGRFGTQSWGKPTSPRSILFYHNAPIKESFRYMLRRLQEVVDVKSFRYWVDPDTGSSKGQGTIGFETPEIAAKALEKLKGMHINGRPLEVRWYETPKKGRN